MKQQTTLVVGLGASAGGIHALQAFFSKIPDDPDLAFVIVTHLSPDRESRLHDVMRRYTTLPVEVIKDGDPVRAGIVHVMPENVVLSIRDGIFRLLEVDPAHRERKPIDVFFSALAIDQQERAVGIVLSGGDGDGTLGLRVIKKYGGITFAQVANGTGPDNPEMPESAIASGAVDFALSAEEMPSTLLKVQKAAALSVQLLHEEPTTSETEQRRMQDEISQLLRDHSGRDFAGYRSKTFFRRVARRMQVTQTTTTGAYLERLRKDPSEVMELFRDLLISVTDFFRDADAFNALNLHVIPSLLTNRGANDTLRVWVPGCATGEEVYSLAILIREQMDKLSSHLTPQIFATDIDAPALTVARAARYPGPLLKNVSDERKARFFRRDGASYVLLPEIREMCIFSAHSLISDPPFSNIDLVSCRNLLIYLGSELQQRVISTIHYALKPGGFLFLGSSERLGQYENLFSAIDKKHRIFQSLDLGDRRIRMPIPLEEMQAARSHFEKNDLPQRMTSHRVRQRAERQIMERHSPAHVVVHSEGDIVFFSARTRPYFDTPHGAPSKQLYEIVRRELRQDLRSALRESLENNRPARRHSIMSDGEATLNVYMTVEPLNNSEGGEPMFLIVFHPVDELRRGKAEVSHTEAGQPDAEASKHELREMHERLCVTIEKYETTLEELNNANEELVSLNEEAQSANEELQASKEELQSLIEELNSVNAELNDRVKELDRANTDLRNLYDATGVSSIFLDRDMTIHNFIPAASTFFNLRSSDIGRPLTELAIALRYPMLKQDIREVFETGNPVEHRMPSNGDLSHYLVRSAPYFDEGMVTGVVVTFVDVTTLAHAEDQRAILITEASNQATLMTEVRAADARKSRLMAVLAHDLRTPLIALLSTLDLFHKGMRNEDLDLMFHRLNEAGHGMLRLIDDVLELARLSSGEAVLRPEPFTPKVLLTQVVDLVRPAADRNETEVGVHIDPMPMLLGDVMSLQRVMLNFATNAVKATRSGSVLLSATPGVTGPKGLTVTFSVTDNGCGIASGDIPRLFRDFGMLERDGTTLDGTGLGLAICRRLASAMDGEVGVESTLGKGSRFWLKVTLPEADNKVLPSDHWQNDPAAILAGLRVLVAEDHEMIRQLTCAKLTRIGMLPTEAADGEIAVTLAEAEEFDMILMDLKMPRLDGDMAADRIRRGGGPSAQAWIIAVTAHQSPEIAMMLSDLAFDACLRKPLDLQQLAAVTRGLAPLAPAFTALVPASATTEDFDPDGLAYLREIDGGTLLMRSLKKFSAEIEETRLKLAVLIGKRDTYNAGRLIHKLVGVSDILGAKTLSIALRKFEGLIHAGDIEALDEALDWIEDVMSKSGAKVDLLVQEIDQHSSGEV
ncbi:CheR family methyltransferase [Pseudogemmobacter sp. W21_MBD1_M6]|uniref:CheR family methyltransferase n=1 Tax=Pseudogemmobacter sp. W21_MBD1_M6 TaxID=3240271 RepID=UPI003F99CDE2